MNQILRYTSILILSTLSIVANAQVSNCAFKLEEAEALYETGILDSIPSMLRACITYNGFDDEELARAYKLLILTYQFEDYQEMAELTMLKFLKKFPEYELKATDPVEFTYLYKSYQTIPTFSVGIIVGGNYSFVRIIEPYSLIDTEDYEGEYSVSGIKVQGGLQFKKYITDKIDINLDVIYTVKGFEYVSNQFNYTTTYTETQSMLSFPLSGTYDFKLGTWSPYLRAGFNVDYMFDAKANFEKKYPENPALNLKETDVDILMDRNTINISALVGGGLKYNIKMGYIILDLRYHFGFMNNVNADNRYIYETKGSYSYIDDEFTLNNFYFSVGWVYSFYKTKQNK